MTVLVQMRDIAQPHHLKVFPVNDQNEMVRMEVYTGRIEANFYGGGGTVHRERFVSLLPIDDQFEVHSYDPATDIRDVQMALTVTPSTFQDDDDETNLVGVDHVDLVLENQRFAGQQGFCFLLHTRVAAHHVNLIALTYHVTIVTPILRQAPQILLLDADQTPT